MRQNENSSDLYWTMVCVENEIILAFFAQFNKILEGCLINRVEVRLPKTADWWRWGLRRRSYRLLELREGQHIPLLLWFCIHHFCRWFANSLIESIFFFANKLISIGVTSNSDIEQTSLRFHSSHPTWALCKSRRSF